MLEMFLVLTALGDSAQPAPSASQPSAGCAAALAAEVHLPSFVSPSMETPVRRPTAEQLEALRAAAERRFKTVANRMCVRGELSADAFRPFRRLLVQQGDGANESTFYSGEAEVGADALVFQYSWDEGAEAVSYAVPDEEDVRDGLLCWADFEAHRAMCEERVP